MTTEQGSEYIMEPMADNVLKALVWELPESVARHALPIIQAELDRLRKENVWLKEKLKDTIGDVLTVEIIENYFKRMKGENDDNR